MYFVVVMRVLVNFFFDIWVLVEFKDLEGRMGYVGFLNMVMVIWISKVSLF